MQKKIAKTTKIWTDIFDGKDHYLVTSNDVRSQYTLFKVIKEGDVICGYEKLGSGANPFDLEDKYIWKARKKKK